MGASNRAQRLSGVNPLAYLGVEPSTPPLLVVSSSSPTSDDVNGFFLGSIWVVTPAPYQIWFLVSQAQNIATWVQIYPSSLSGAVSKFTAQTGSNPVVPTVGGNVNLTGTSSIAGLLTTSGAANTVDFILGGAVAASFVTGTGTATPALNVLTVSGGSGVVKTTGAGSTVTVGLTAATDGQLIIGSSTGNPAWANLTSTGGSVAITNGHNSINLEATGVDTGAITFDTNTTPATVSGTTITIAGGSNINTSGAASTVTINLNNSILLPTTTANQLNGVISINSTSFLQAYGTANTFLGSGSGNFTLTTADAVRNTGVGNLVLEGLTTGAQNTCVGYVSGSDITSGSSNQCFGYGSGFNLTTGSNNVLVGTSAGNSYTTEGSNICLGNLGTVADANTIRVGTQGSGAGQQNKCFVAGITGVTTANSNYVTVNTATGQLGATTVSPVGVAGTQSFSYYLATSNTVTILSAPRLNYNMGSGQALVELFDNTSGNFFPGDGAGTGAFFTAPATGIYQFIWQLLMIRNASGSGTNNALLQINMNFIATANQWTNTFPGTSTSLSSVSGSGTSQIISWCLTVLAPMTAGDTMEFNVQDGVTATTYNFRGTDLLTGYIGNYLSGYRVA